MARTTSPGSPKSQRDLMPALLLYAAAFSNVSFFPTPFDTQPYALLIAACIVLRRLTREEFARLPGVLLVPYIVTAAALASLVSSSGPLVAGARSVIGYVSLAVIATAVYLSRQSRYGMVVPVVALVYLLTGLAQRLLSPTFGSFAVARMATSEGRGVTSLAVEPSLYAVNLTFLLLINDYCVARADYGRRVYRLVFLLLCLQFLLAASALGFLLLGCYLLLRAMTAGRFWRLVGNLSLTAVAVSAFSWALRNVDFLRSTRAAHLVMDASQSLDTVIYDDQSVAERMFALQASHESLLYSGGLGYGVGTWESGLASLLMESRYDLIRYGVTDSDGGRVMSGFGAGLYELGIIGLLSPIALAVAVLSARNRSPSGCARWAIVAGGTAFIAMECAVPLAFPMFCLVYGQIACLGTKTAAGRSNASTAGRPISRSARSRTGETMPSRGIREP